jgi:hypothetical protein
MSLLRRYNMTPPAVPPPGTRDRRSVCRYSVVLDKAWIGWWEGQSFRYSGARIVDISLRGALLHIEKFPPNGQPVWLCPPGVTSQEEWIEVKLIDARKKLFGPRVLRLAFRKVFPYEIFRNVVYGPDVFQTVPQEWLPEDACERDWW